MPHLQLRNLNSNESFTFDASPVVCGRASACDISVVGEGAEVVSGKHARFVTQQGSWMLEDLGSRNGTFLNDKQLVPGRPMVVSSNDVVGLGAAGPRFKVIQTAVTGDVEKTVVELKAVSAVGGGSGHSSEASFEVMLRNTKTGDVYRGRGQRMRMGRGSECDVRPVVPGDTSVSRVHAEVVLLASGGVVIRDADSRNGTFHNGTRVTESTELKVGDRLMLGRGGPEVVIETLKIDVPTPVKELVGKPTEAMSPVSTPSSESVPPTPVSLPEEPPRRSFGGQGRTVFVQQVIQETAKKSSDKLRRFVWTAVVVLTTCVVGVYVFNERRVRAATDALERTTEALALQSALVDSIRMAADANLQRLQSELADARASSAPASVVDSLRAALTVAQDRTTAIEASLERARSDLDGQLASAEALRRERENEAQRLQDELQRASTASVSTGFLDSLRRALDEAQARSRQLDQQVRAVRGVNLANVAQANQGAVGLVAAYLDDRIVYGSGFVISPSGFFITNRHVVMPEGGYADSLFITMADRSDRARALVVRIQETPGPDLAVLRIVDYAGPHVPRVDWSGSRAAQGEPAALIGFPAGRVIAVDRGSSRVRTSMSAGIFSKVGQDGIQFDGFTVGGSSGSPIFNADGEVVAVHRAGLAGDAGLSFAVPIPLAIPLLPVELRQELGLGAR